MFINSVLVIHVKGFPKVRVIALARIVLSVVDIVQPNPVGHYSQSSSGMHLNDRDVSSSKEESGIRCILMLFCVQLLGISVFNWNGFFQSEKGALTGASGYMRVRESSTRLTSSPPVLRFRFEEDNGSLECPSHLENPLL
ncbi:hypothetical protein Tco_0290468 [Tanacetum coccineum]